MADDWRKTSENGIVDPLSAHPPMALLGDFDIEGSKLKRNHHNWLRDEVVTPIKAFAGPRARITWHIRLTGSASQSGDQAYNRTLSIQRIESVRRYLLAELGGEPLLFHPVPLGEERPKVAGADENWADRAVEVLVVLERSWRPKPPILIIKPKRLPRRHKTGEFHIRVVSGTMTTNSAPDPPVLKPPAWAKALPKAFMADVDLKLEVLEVGASNVANYRFSGRGPGTCFGKMFSKITYLGGEPHPFKAPTPMFEVDDFAGHAVLVDHLIGGRDFRFGPRKNVFLPPSIKINEIDLGREMSTFGAAVGVEYDALGEMTLVK